METNSGARYEKDVIAWASEQAALLRAGRFSALDIEHLAGEIEDVGKSGQSELAHWIATLLAHLLKWQHQPGHRTTSWQHALKNQRAWISAHLRKAPSLKSILTDTNWVADMWADARDIVNRETARDDLAGLANLAHAAFPENCPWSMEQVLSAEFYPDAP